MSEARTILHSPIPAFARELIGVIGEADTLELCRHCGGMEITVPRHPHPDSLLTLLLGPQSAGRLCARYGGCRIEPPRLTQAWLSLRNAAIRARRAEGASTEQLAREWGTTQRTIRRVMSTGG